VSTRRREGLSDLIARGELSATAYLDVVDARAEPWVERELGRLDEHLTLRHPDVVLLLAGIIGVLLLAAIGVGVSL
jgi:hypothetical protein